ncbi:unnamed protein product [Withania somnifera]
MEASEAKIEDSVFQVDGDGRLVPATQDEIMVVEDLLEDVKCEPKLVPDTRQISESCKTERYLMERNSVQVSEDPVVGAEKSNVLVDAVPDLGKIGAPEKVAVHGLAPFSELSDVDLSVRTDVCSYTQDAPNEDAPSTSAACSSWKPDFSKLEGKICLDNLTVKELQETFKASFGRETSLKDKQWLKRRITMGLTSSCDFSCTTFIIRDNVVLKIGENQKCHQLKSRISADSEDGVANSDSRAALGDHDNRMNDDTDLSGGVVSSSAFESCNVTKDLYTEQRTAKRTHKPTKRYIEELSEIESRESIEKLASPDKISRYRFACPETHMRPTKNVRSNARQLVTRHDSLGGSWIQIPSLNIAETSACGMYMVTKQVRSAFDVSGTQEAEQRNNDLIKASSSPGWTQLPLIAGCEKDEHYSGVKIVELENEVELNYCSEDNSDDNLVIVPTQKGGMRRKHHRPWTINEVVKLVEGVVRYGAGRWSEIKRLAFASCPYRTSMDLKWRNLLKASFVKLPADKRILNSRKQAAVPIPAPILLRVRELADMEGQIPPVLSTGKSSGYNSSDRSVHEAKSGFL